MATNRVNQIQISGCSSGIMFIYGHQKRGSWRNDFRVNKCTCNYHPQLFLIDSLFRFSGYGYADLTHTKEMVSGSELVLDNFYNLHCQSHSVMEKLLDDIW
jgi:hypothetical protein